MTNSTRLIGLIMTAALWAGGARAQELPSDWDDATPPDLSLPSLDTEGLPALAPPGDRGQSVLVDPSGDYHEPFDGYQPDCEDCAPGLHDYWHGPTAEIESTSTWLRRGFWYAEAEAVVWNRLWNRDDKLFAAADQDVEDTTFFFNQIVDLNTNRVLIVSGAHPGQDASVRATLGHFLFRDSMNRDHTAEFTAFAGGDWHQNRIISSPTNFGLFVPFYIDGTQGTGPFDQSTRQTVEYSSHYSSFEGNYRVRQRLRRDRMIMDANGHWHRATNSGFVREYLVGLRMVEARDLLDWRAEDIRIGTTTQLGNNGTYLIRTDNDMFGFQLGTGLTYETSRWSLGVQTKGGVFMNDALGRNTLDLTMVDTFEHDLRFREDELSFIGEAKLLARWNLTPNFSLRAAYEMMYLTSQALAPNQATFIPEFAYLNTTQDPFYHGASFGFEGYW
ncbi:MAG: BBP7 family outer membrane beta-barrel protein [Pirellulales bacterium]